MPIPEEIKANIWIKNWSGNWRTGFASLYWVYTRGLRKYIGKNLKTSLIVCEKNVSSNYISKDNLDNYCNFSANLVIKNPGLVQKWAEDTLKTAEQIFLFLNKIKKTGAYTKENLQELKNKFYIHIPPHFSMKKVVDYLPLELQKTLIPRLAEARVRTENLFNAIDEVMRCFAENISKKTGINPALTRFLTIEEIEAYFKRNKLPNEKDLIKRHKGTAIFYFGEKFKIFFGEEFKAIERTLIRKSGRILKGFSAYRGIARGLVRIVTDPAEALDFKKGNVLVAGMTRPEFLPLMKKAAGIITDAGGILSHAAIAARELKKPCIIGTEIASKILQDGDIVEMDANKGIVRKLK